MKKIIKMIIISLIILITIINENSFATSSSTGGGGGHSFGSGSSASASSGSSSSADTDTSGAGVQSAADGFIRRGTQQDVMPIGKIISDLFPVGRTVQAVAILVLLVVGLIIGVKFMISGTDQKAKMKERLIWYVVAAVLVFGAVEIYNIVAGIVNSAGI